MIVGAVNDKTSVGLDRTAGKDACPARDRRFLLAEYLEDGGERMFPDRPV